MTLGYSETSNQRLIDDHFVYNPVTSAYEASVVLNARAPRNFTNDNTMTGDVYDKFFTNVTSTNNTAPNGATNATLYEANTSNTVHFLRQNGVQNAGADGVLSVGEPFCCEAFVKAGTLTDIDVTISQAISSTTARFNLSTGARTSGSTSINIEPVGGGDPDSNATGWYRIFTTGLVATSAVDPRIEINPRKAGVASFAGVAGDNWYLWYMTVDIERSTPPWGRPGIPYRSNSTDNASMYLAFELTNLETPEACTLHVEWIDRGAYPTRATSGVLRLGDYLGTAVGSLKVEQTSTGFDATWETVAGTSVSSVSLVPSVGDLVGVHVTLSAAGAITLTAYKNAETAVEGSAGTARALPGSWSDNLMWVGSSGAASSSMDMYLLRASARPGITALADIR